MQATTMTAIEITQAGGPEVLQVCTRPVPQPGPGLNQSGLRWY